MKHTWMITILFLAFFVTAQLIGLILISSQTEVTETDGEIEIKFVETALIQRPEVSGFDSILYIVMGVGIGTVLLLLLAKARKVNWWRAWFMLAVWLAVTMAIGAIFPGSPIWVPLIIAAILTWWKIYHPNVYIQNSTEILMYAGIAVLLVPILNILTAIIILLLFSLYDAYAVWKSKHMVKMAEFTMDAKLFPGFSLSYSVQKNKKTKLFHKFGDRKSDDPPEPPKDTGRKTGILGGGDVVFPMLFAGVVMLDLIARGFSKQMALNLSLIVVLGATASLLYLFVFAKKDKFYPAMPFLTTGCLVGWGFMWLVMFLV